MTTLGTIDNEDSPLGGGLQLLQQIGTIRREVPGPIRLQYDAKGGCLKENFDSFRCNGWEEAEQADVPVHGRVHSEWGDIPGSENVLVVDCEK